MAQLLDQRAELLVGVRLVRAGVLVKMGKETPDFECEWRGTEFGVGVTTRARPEAGAAMHDLLEKTVWDGPDVGVTLTRSGKLLFSESPAKTAAIAGQVIASINEHVAAAAGQPVAGSIPIPELGLTAMLHPAPISGPGMRVTYEFLLVPEEWEHHWSMAALQIKDPVENKGRKTYALPSIVVLDVSRLGYAGQMPSRAVDREVPGRAGRLQPVQPRRRSGGALAADLGARGGPVLAGRRLPGARRGSRAAERPDARRGLNRVALQHRGSPRPRVTARRASTDRGHTDGMM